MDILWDTKRGWSPKCTLKSMALAMKKHFYMWPNQTLHELCCLLRPSLIRNSTKWMLPIMLFSTIIWMKKFTQNYHLGWKEIRSMAPSVSWRNPFMVYNNLLELGSVGSAIMRQFLYKQGLICEMGRWRQEINLKRCPQTLFQVKDWKTSVLFSEWMLLEVNQVSSFVRGSILLIF